MNLNEKTLTFAMQILPRILEIKEVQGFAVTCLWHTGEVRLNSFADHAAGRNERLHGLANPAAFQEIIVVDGTLQWPRILLPGLFRGEQVLQPLALDPDTLYRESKLVGTSLKTLMSYELRQARLKAGLTQTKLANLSGTTKEYISQIESGKADFQVSTFDRILQQGLGRSAALRVR